MAERRYCGYNAQVLSQMNLWQIRAGRDAGDVRPRLCRREIRELAYQVLDAACHAARVLARFETQPRNS